MITVQSLLTGCGNDGLPGSVGASLKGAVFSGQEPITGATVQLYSVGTHGDGSASTPLLASAVETDKSGRFDLTGLYRCSSPDTILYLEAKGGSAGTSARNSSIDFLSVLGACSSIAAMPQVVVNETTTLASVASLAPFIKSADRIGFSSADVQAFDSSLANLVQMANPVTGTAPGAVAANSVPPTDKLNTLAAILAGCVESTGGVAGDGTACGSLFAEANEAGLTPPTDTVGAALMIADHPYARVEQIYGMLPKNTVYGPVLATSPADWVLAVSTAPDAPVISPASGSYVGTQTVTITTSVANAVIHYTSDGSAPTAQSAIYSVPLSVNASQTIKAIITTETAKSNVNSSSIAIASDSLVFTSQPSSILANQIMSPVAAMAVGKNGKADTSATGTVTVKLIGTTGGTLQGAVSATLVKGVATFSNLTSSVVGTYQMSASSSCCSSALSPVFNVVPSVFLTSSGSSVTVGQTGSVTFTINKPAGGGGRSLTVTSADTSTVKPTQTTIVVPQGASTGTISYNAVSAGTVLLKASIPGYSVATIPVTVLPAVASVSSGSGSGSGSGTTTVTPAGTPIPATLFGMSMNKASLETLNMPYTIGTTRTWDVYPGLSWISVNPLPGIYNWTALDNYIAANAKTNQADIIYTLGLPPLWASSSPLTAGHDGLGTCAPPASMAIWDAWLTAVATHVKGKIHMWELWNEPEDPGYYCGTVPTMVVLAQHANAILKAIDPTAIISSPADTGGLGPAWLKSFLTSGGAQYVDVVAFHGYWTNTATDGISVMTNVTNAMKAAGISKPMWDTENDWNGTGTPPASYTDRAAFVAQSYLLHWSMGVSRFVWYEYDGGVEGGLWDAVNGIHPDGVAYGQVKDWMVGAVMTQNCAADAKKTYTCILQRKGYQAMAVWNATPTTYTVNPIYKQYRDLTGKVTPISTSTLTVSTEPILLETGTAN